MELIRVAFLKGNIERFGLMCQRKKEITIYGILTILLLSRVQVGFGTALFLSPHLLLRCKRPSLLLARRLSGGSA
jgi:hypothetical protein